jgi:hypothetical protein
MKTEALILGIAFTFLTSTMFADDRRNDDRPIRSTQVSYILEHSGSQSERIIVAYEGMLGTHIWQTGSSSKPFEGHFEDDRECHVSLDVRVYRRAYLVSVSGLQAPVENYQAVYKAITNASRGADGFWEGLTYHRTCGEVDNFQDRVDGAEADLVSQFDTLVSKDDDKAREHLRAMLKGTAIKIAK